MTLFSEPSGSWLKKASFSTVEAAKVGKRMSATTILPRRSASAKCRWLAPMSIPTRQPRARLFRRVPLIDWRVCHDSAEFGGGSAARFGVDQVGIRLGNDVLGADAEKLLEPQRLSTGPFQASGARDGLDFQELSQAATLPPDQFVLRDEIWIADIPSGACTLLASGSGIGWPEWSPNGSRIGYVSSNGTVVHELATGRKKTLNRTPSTSWGGTIWSPTGAYFVIDHWDAFLPGDDAIYRFTSDIGGKTELTSGLYNPFPRVLDPVGWRN